MEHNPARSGQESIRRDRLHHPSIQYRVLIAWLVPPLIAGLAPPFAWLVVSSLNFITRNQALPIPFVAIALILLGRLKIHSLCRSKASYDRAMQRNRLRLPGMALAVSIVTCAVLSPYLQYIWEPSPLYIPCAWNSMGFMAAIFMAIVGLQVSCRFAGIGFGTSACKPLGNVFHAC